MHFEGSFELEGMTLEEVWLGLSDPVLIATVLPGCQFLEPVDDPGNVDFETLADRAADVDQTPETLPEADPDDVAARAFEAGEHYAARMQVGIGSIKPTFDTVVTIAERDLPAMRATGEGHSSDSSFELDSWMTLSETDDGVEIEWEADTDVFGRIARMGQRLLSPVANRLVNRFFKDVEERLRDVSEEPESSGLRARIRDAI